MKNIAFFGGSFNPIHNGHLEIMDKLLSNKFVDEVLVVPCGNHAFGKELLSAKERIDLIKLGIGNNPQIKISDLEITSFEKSYTANTLRKLKQTSDDKYMLVIGADNVSSFDKWFNWTYIRENFEFVVARRPGCNFENDDGLKIKYVINMYNEASSSEIRARLHDSLSLEGMVPKIVEEYIIKHELYRK